MRFNLVLFSVLLCFSGFTLDEKAILAEIERAEQLIYTDPEEAKYVASEMYVESNEIGFDLGVARSYLLVGRGYVMTSEFGNAISSLNIALEYAQKVGSQSLISDCYYYLGKAYHITGDTQKQLEYQNMSYDIRKTLDDPARLAESHHAFGNLHFGIGEDSLAAIDWQTALDIRTDLNDEIGMAGLYNNLGLVERNKDNISGYQELLRKAIAINERLNNKRALATNFGNMGLSFLTIENNDSAWVFAFKSFEIRKANGFTDHLAGSYGDLGDIKVAQGEYSTAKSYYSEGLKLAKEIEGTEWILKNCKALAEVYELEENTDSADYFNQRALALEDSLATVSINVSEFAKIEVAEEEPEKDDGSEGGLGYFAYLSIAGALAIIGYIIYFIRKEKKGPQP